jgi:hypothetical protein
MREEIPLLTVKALRERLAAIPDDYIIIAEGCDCAGVASDIERDDSDRSVLISRHPMWSSGGSPNLDERLRNGESVADTECTCPSHLTVHAKECPVAIVYARFCKWLREADAKR